MKSKFLKFFLFSISIPLFSSAQISLSPSLKQAIEAAIEQSSTVKNNNLENAKNQMNEKGVLNKYIPKIAATGAYSYVNNHLDLDIPAVQLPLTDHKLFDGSTTIQNKGNLFLAGISAQQVLFSGGQIINGHKALKAKNEGEALMNELEKDKIVKEVIGAFDQLKLIEAGLRLIDESEIRLQKEKQRVETAIQQGLAVPYDRDKIELATLNLNSRKEDILGKQELLKLKIAYLTGYNQEQIEAVQYDLEPILVNANLNIENRTELKALNAFDRALRFNLKKEKGSLLPNVGLMANYGYASLFHTDTRINFNFKDSPTEMKLNHATLSPNWMVGIALKWNILDGMERRHKIHSVQIDQEMLANKKEDSKQMMQLQLENNKVNYQTAFNQLHISKQKEKIAQNNLLTADKQYKLGLIGITERLAAETDVYDNSLQNVQDVIQQRQIALDLLSASELLIDQIN